MLITRLEAAKLNPEKFTIEAALEGYNYDFSKKLLPGGTHEESASHHDELREHHVDQMDALRQHALSNPNLSNQDRRKIKSEINEHQYYAQRHKDLSDYHSAKDNKQRAVNNKQNDPPISNVTNNEPIEKNEPISKISQSPGLMSRISNRAARFWHSLKPSQKHAYASQHQNSPITQAHFQPQPMPQETIPQAVNSRRSQSKYHIKMMNKLMAKQQSAPENVKNSLDEHVKYHQNAADIHEKNADTLEAMHQNGNTSNEYQEPPAPPKSVRQVMPAGASKSYGTSFKYEPNPNNANYAPKPMPETNPNIHPMPKSSGFDNERTGINLAHKYPGAPANFHPMFHKDKTNQKWRELHPDEKVAQSSRVKHVPKNGKNYIAVDQ